MRVSGRLGISSLIGLVVAATVAIASFGVAPASSLHGDDEAAADQIASGLNVYETVCSRCHGLAGEGGDGPALVGPRALRSFRTTKRLFDYVRISMPDDAPGSLAPQEYYDVLAFLLDWNELNPDGVVVDAESVEDLVLQ